MSDQNEKINKASIVLTALSLIAAIYFGVAGHFSSQKIAELEEENLRLTQRSASLDAFYSSGALVLKGDSLGFVQPEHISVTPVFAMKNGPPKTGEPVKIPTNTGVVAVQERTITFNDLAGRICSYKKNSTLCADPDASLETVLVTFTVNGKRDSDPLRIEPQS